MKKVSATLVIVLCVYLTSAAQEWPFNVLLLANGTYILKAPPTYKSIPETGNEIIPWTKEAIIDGTDQRGWSSAGKDATFPMEFVFELSEECIIEKFAFNTMCEKQYPGICAKDVRMEVSTTGPDKGYKVAGEYKLADHGSDAYFKIEPTHARWIRMTILSNNGFTDYTELMEVEAWGKYANPNPPKIDLTGDWESTWGLASLRQQGSNVDGCYEYRKGVVQNSGMERRILTYEWVEQGENGVGHAVLVVNEEGTRLNGIWGFGDDLNRYGIWVFRKKSNSPTLCYQENRTEEAKKKEEEVKIENMKKEIETKGKLILYGINFETNSANIKEESYPTLNEILSLLNANTSMKLKIEGHTDNVGGNMPNLRLSMDRAESVKKYLIGKGIETQRLTTSGKGEDAPIADNSTELGKAANRRVELLLQ